MPASAPQSASVIPAPTSSSGTYLAANFAASEGDVKNAAEYFSNLLKTDPNNGDLLARTFLYYASAGDVEHAVPLADRLIAQDENNRPAHLVRALSLLSKKDYAGAAANPRPRAGACSMH